MEAKETPAYTPMSWESARKAMAEAMKRMEEHRRTVALEKLAKVAPQVIKGTPDGDELKRRKARANAKQKAKFKNAGDRKKIRAEYAVLITRPDMTATAAHEQLADQAQHGRAGKAKLSMKYDATPVLATRFDIRRIVTTTD
jgi:hypothetical protein